MKKRLSLFISILIILCLSILSVSATNTVQDGLQATVTSDKTRYFQGEDIHCTFEVKNTNDFAIDNVSLWALILKGLKLKDEQDKILVGTKTLKAGEMLSFSLTLIEDTMSPTNSAQHENSTTISTTTTNNNSTNNSITNGKTVNTGVKVIAITVVSILFVVSFILLLVFRKKKTTRNIMTFFLCTSILSSTVVLANINTYATEIKVMNFIVAHKITVSYKEYKISAKVKYDKIHHEQPTKFISENNYTAEDLINKSVTEIVKMMDNQFDVSLIDGSYFYNYNKFPGMNFYLVNFEDSETKLREIINNGNVNIKGIQVNNSGKGCRNGDKILKADMDFVKCAEIYGNFTCKPSNGAMVSGGVEAVCYEQEKDGYTVIVNFQITDGVGKLLAESVHNNTEISYDEMLKENPPIKNIVIRKTETPTETPTNIPSEDHISKPLHLQKTGYIDGKLYYAQDYKWNYVDNDIISEFPDNLRNKIGCFFVLDDYIYYTPTNINGSGGFSVELRRIHFDGSGDELLTDSLSFGSNCVYTDGYLIYYSYDENDSSKNGFSYVHLETKDKTYHFIHANSTYVYNGKVYFTESYPQKSIIKSQAIFDGKEETLINSEATILFLDNQYLYYVDNATNNLRRINLNDYSDTEIVLNNIDEYGLPPYNCDIHDGIIYYSPSTDGDTAQIKAYDTKSKTDTIIATVQAQTGIKRLVYENGYILYTVQNDPSTISASDYMLNLENKSVECISNYDLSSF